MECKKKYLLKILVDYIKNNLSKVVGNDLCILRNVCLLDLECEWLIDLEKILKDNMASFKNNLDLVNENCKRFHNAT